MTQATAIAKRPLVIYHAGCTDGFTAAWAVWWGLLCTGHERAELVPAQYGDTPPEVSGRDVWVVDFTYPRALLLEMEASARSLLVLDHHRTAREELADLPFATFDMDRSGAGLAWDEVVAPFTGYSRPWLIDYVEDRDLWRWELPNSREVNAAVRAREPDVDTWSILAFGCRAEELVSEGRAILADQERTIGMHAERARRCWLLGVRPPEAGAPLVVNATVLQSEIGNRLARAAPFAAMWREIDDGFVYSLRSSPENPDHLDVSVIAQHFGGGGHRHAAAFSSSRLVHRQVGEATRMADYLGGWGVRS